MNALRLLLDPPQDGGTNMAVDEVLLASAAAGQSTLRFYQWTPATLSLGYFQPAASRDEHLPSRSSPLVRRASGGGAILHDHELTYSFAVPAANRFSQDAERYYDLFHATLIETLTEWKVSAALFRDLPATGRPAKEDAFLCFQRRTANDVVLNGWKIAGSAQRRHGGALLQHGSVLLARSRFAPELLGIAEIAAVQISAAVLAAAWLRRLAKALEVEPQRGGLSAAEQAAVPAERERFVADAWTLRR